jgi:two-component system, chemotaxis family, chemotaxis protein CheY
MQALIVDDSRALRRILSDMLRQLGFEVAEAVNGRDALQKLEESACPDIVLVDWNMPEMNGLEFIKEVRAQQRFASLPLMMVTTETEMEQMVAALAAGANEYVMKPFGREILADKLNLLGLAVG